MVVAQSHVRQHDEVTDANAQADPPRQRETAIADLCATPRNPMARARSPLRDDAPDRKLQEDVFDMDWALFGAKPVRNPTPHPALGGDPVWVPLRPHEIGAAGATGQSTFREPEARHVANSGGGLGIYPDVQCPNGPNGLTPHLDHDMFGDLLGYSPLVRPAPQGGHEVG